MQPSNSNFEDISKPPSGAFQKAISDWKKGKYFAENDPQCFKVLLLHVFAFRGAFSTLQNVNFDVIQRMFGKSILHKLSSTSANWHFSLVKTMTNQR